MSKEKIIVFGREYDCSSCWRTGFDSADMPSHAATCRSKVALLFAIPKKYVVLRNGKRYIQFPLEFENRAVNII